MSILQNVCMKYVDLKPWCSPKKKQKKVVDRNTVEHAITAHRLTMAQCAYPNQRSYHPEMLWQFGSQTEKLPLTVASIVHEVRKMQFALYWTFVAIMNRWHRT